jgi:hypothetical protein
MGELTPQEKLKKLTLLKKKAELIEGLPHLHGQKFYAWARTFFESRKRFNLLCAANQIGKAELTTREIPTSDGFKPMGELVPGDRVFGSDGKPCLVKAISWEGVTEFYRVTFGDGSTIEVSGNHLWKCKGERQRFFKYYRGKKCKSSDYGQWVVSSTEEIRRVGRYDGQRVQKAVHRFVIPFTEPVQYQKKELFDPYALGLLLGDGSFSTCTVTLCKPDREILDYMIGKHGAVLRSKLDTVSFPVASSEVKRVLTQLGLIGSDSLSKFIPPEYLAGSVEQRLALLQGLMDTDGHITEKSAIEFSTSSPRLADGFRELVASLGGSHQTKRFLPTFTHKGEKKVGKPSQKIAIKMPDGLNPFRLQRKARKFYRTRYAHERVIYSIEPIGPRTARCIEVDSTDRTYLSGREYIVTHNSSVQIRRMIHMATEPKVWPEFWAHRPLQFWYLYPTKEIATMEFLSKIEPQFLPRGAMKDHPQYGWEAEYRNRYIWSIRFKTGVTCYFRTYATDVQHLQAGSVDAIFCDEELPADLYPELLMRLSGTWGYFHMVFTATLAQPFWYDAMERIGRAGERLKEDTLKLQVSMYDCLRFEDGTPSHWSVERIKKVERACQSEAEVQKRIFGRFVAVEGRRYPAFDRERNVMKGHPLPINWLIYAGVDLGSGGETGHPAAIVFVAVSPDFTKGRVFKGWRGDAVQTTASDVLHKFIELKAGLTCAGQFYDWASKDFQMIAQRMNEPFQAADKSHDTGEQILNVLFKNQMLQIYDQEELEPLCDELSSLLVTTNKTKAHDDFCDALRYAVSKIPWNWSVLNAPEVEVVEEHRILSTDEQRRMVPSDGFDSLIEEELASWAELYEV